MTTVNFKKNIFILFLLFSTSCTGSSVTSMLGNAAFSEKGLKTSLKDAYTFSKIKTKFTSLNLVSIAEIGVHVSLGRVLLIGNTSSSNERLELVKATWSIPGVIEVYNEIKIKENYSILERLNDKFIEGKVTAKLLLEPNILSNNYSLQVFKKDLFIIGISRNIEEKNKLYVLLNEFTQIKKIISFVILKKQTANINENQ